MILDAANLFELGEKEFEDFCHQLVSSELVERFAPGAAEVPEGPTPRGHKDGGRDLRARVYAPPETRVHFSLLPDEPGEVRFSCKTQNDKAGTNWKVLVRRDVDPAGLWNKKARPQSDIETRIKEDNKTNQKLVAAIAGGGRYTVLLNCRGSKVEEFEEEVATRFKVLAQALGIPVVGDLRQRVRVFDASWIAQAYRLRPFALSETLEKKLRLERLDFLQSWTDWTSAFEAERRRMAFQRDAHRDDVIEAVQRLLASEDPAENMVRLVGPPGVGKTRVVHRALEAVDGVEDRVRYSTDADDVAAWLEKGGLAQIPDTVLVVDEVTDERVSRLSRGFKRSAAGKPSARLIAIGPREGASTDDPYVVHIDKLGDRAIEAIVDAELSAAGHDPGALVTVKSRILGLCEGYPLFALWLSRALAADEELLRDPGRKLTDEQDPWFVTSLVLIGSQRERTFASDIEWKQQATLHGKAILLVLLAHRDDWDSLGEDQERALEQALEASWADLRVAARFCEQRGLIRRVAGTRRYISPANLERMVLNHFFGGPEPELPPKRIARYVPGRFGRLLERATAVGAADRAQDRVARAVLEAWATVEIPGPHLLAAAQRLPVQACEAVDTRLAAGRTGQGSRLMSVLGHLRHRKIPRSAFAIVERGMFELELEREHGEWRGLFRTALHSTRQPFEFRFSLLARRLETGDADSRTRAITGLEAAIQRDGGAAYHPGIDDVDGPFEKITDEEAQRQERIAWARLAELTTDSDERVAARARRGIARYFRTAVVFCLQVDELDELASLVGEWTAGERNQLGEALDEVGRYERRSDTRVAHELGDALDRLDAALAPTDLHERVMAQVGRWSPGKAPIDARDGISHDASRDEALARDLLREPSCLEREIKWLTSDAAVRAGPFARALGKVDASLSAYDQLAAVLSSRSSEEFLAQYIVGWGTAVGDDRADPWLEAHADAEGLAGVVTRSLTLLPANSRRAALLVELLERGIAVDEPLARIGSWGWANALSLDELDDLVVALVARGSESAFLGALGLGARRLECPADGLDAIRGPLREAVQAVAGVNFVAVGEIAWSDVAAALVQAGEVGLMTEVFRALGSRARRYHVTRMLQTLVKAGLSRQVWQELLAYLEERPLAAVPLRSLVDEVGLSREPPLDLIEEWLGKSEERGFVVAELASPHARELDVLSLVVLRTFVPESRPWRTLLARASSTPGAVSSLSAFFDRQAQNAAGWARSAEAPVRRWAERVRDAAAERAAFHRAEEEYEARFGYG